MAFISGKISTANITERFERDPKDPSGRLSFQLDNQKYEIKKTCSPGLDSVWTINDSSGESLAAFMSTNALSYAFVGDLNGDGVKDVRLFANDPITHAKKMFVFQNGESLNAGDSLQAVQEESSLSDFLLGKNLKNDFDLAKQFIEEGRTNDAAFIYRTIVDANRNYPQTEVDQKKAKMYQRAISAHHDGEDPLDLRVFSTPRRKTPEAVMRDEAAFKLLDMADSSKEDKKAAIKCLANDGYGAQDIPETQWSSVETLALEMLPQEQEQGSKVSLI